MVNNIIFGPGGLGSAKDSIDNLRLYNHLGLGACEVEFTYSVYLKRDEDMKKIKKTAKENGIRLSVHAPYWINLNSKEKEKVEASKQRILKSCEIGEKLGAKIVVFHPGYYGNMEKEETYQNIKQRILEIQEVIKKNNWKIKLGPETTGRISVFGSLDETARLVKETGCRFVLDFAHILAREKELDWSRIKKLFPDKRWHCHFSGNEIGEKGEKKHRKTTKEDFNKIIPNLPKDKEIIIINESPYPIEDSILGLSLV